MSIWDLQVGDELTRDERRKKFGGGLYGGIESSAQTPNVFIYSDPSKGTKHGYDFDGWVENGTVFQYTGEGRIGDQKMNRGNLAILNHLQRNKALRVFTANGIVEGTKSTKRQIYIGEFRIDDTHPYFKESSKDDNEDFRSVFVFRLLPTEKTKIRTIDYCPNPAPPKSVEIKEVVVGVVDIEKTNTDRFETRPMESKEGTRSESLLRDRYVKFLKFKEHDVKGREVRVPGKTHPLRVDLFDETTQELCEVKSSSARGHIRYAIGQILDYSRYINPQSKSILLPNRPSDDLVNLLRSLDIVCIFETQKGKFERLD